MISLTLESDPVAWAKINELTIITNNYETQLMIVLMKHRFVI